MGPFSSERRSLEVASRVEQRELALARRHARREKELMEHTKKLKPLQVNQVVIVQNQAGNLGL